MMLHRGSIIALATSLWLAGCGGGKSDGANACVQAAEKARACAAELCKAGTLDAYGQETWCGATTPADDPKVKACATSRCGEQLTEHTDGRECPKLLNGFDNALSIACE